MSEQLANQIAAGEVVERPASVVKELVENALDAEAHRLLIETEDGGRRLIRVTDDGTGMSADDALLSLERHATSKIKTEADLWRITSLGFRGEALGAIASVCRLALMTRERGALSGALVKAVGGEVREATEAGLPEGTSVEVRDLFFNTPGRRKFLRSAKTELAHIAEVVIQLALWRPGVYVELRDDGRDVLRVPATESIPERIGALLGREVLGHLFAIDAEYPFFSISGFASNPDFNRSSPKNIFPYINGRHVRDRVLVSAVSGAYEGHLLKGRYPVAVFNVHIDPELVDVNVHPTKAEVRFRQAAGVFEGVRKATARALSARFGAAEGAGFLARYGRSTSALQEPNATETGDAKPAPAMNEQPAWFDRRPQHTPTRMDIVLPPDQPEPQVGRFANLAIIGQLADNYILCENRAAGGSLLLIDQHAAHERVNYERLRRQMESGAIEVQNLLLPLELELRPVESQALEAIVDDLARVGVVVAPFGPHAWRIEAAPALLDTADARRLVLDCLEQARETGTAGKPAEPLESILILAACHGSVRAGQALTLAQMREILRGLDTCEQPTSCPHGRPTIREYPLAEIERAFGRR
jgi:DNA mismatch repair protein MutL